VRVNRRWVRPFLADTQELTHVTPGDGCGSGSEMSNKISNKSGLLSLVWDNGGWEGDEDCGSPSIGYKSSPSTAVCFCMFTQRVKYCRTSDPTRCWEGDASVNQQSFLA
jgi:hypothetical protein